MIQRSEDEVACRSEEEILEEWERNGQHSALDISVWEILKHRVPKYSKYDDLAVDSNANNSTLTDQVTNPTFNQRYCCNLRHLKGKSHIAKKIYIYDNSENFELQSWYEKQNQTRVDLKHFPGQVKQKSA